jgi:CheY-like chemotaxis protein
VATARLLHTPNTAGITGRLAEAADGLEAVQKAQELKPDLILLDIGLPNLVDWTLRIASAKLFPTRK